MKTKRLQVLLPEDELNKYVELAKAMKISMASLIRNALNSNLIEQRKLKKLEAINKFSHYSSSLPVPAPGIDLMLREIEEGAE